MKLTIETENVLSFGRLQCYGAKKDLSFGRFFKRDDLIPNASFLTTGWR